MADLPHTSFEGPANRRMLVRAVAASSVVVKS